MEEYDPLQMVSSLLIMSRDRCKTIYQPKQHISVDERMVATKARLKIKQYMKAKPAKWGLKISVLAYVNGYTVDYRLYAGKSQGASGKGLPFDVVTELVKKSYLGRGYLVYCDNLYTSPILFRHLSQQRFGACGTYRQGRAGVPTTQENALEKKIKDRFHQVEDNETAKRQFFGTFWTFVTNSLTKSFIVHKELSKMQQQKPTTRQAFQEELCATLFTVPLANPSQPPTQGHFPVPTNENYSTDKRQKASMGRKQCTLCKKSTPWKCEESKVGLSWTGTASRNSTAEKKALYICK